jgi:hypothetical protein
MGRLLDSPKAPDLRASSVPTPPASTAAAPLPDLLDRAALQQIMQGIQKPRQEVAPDRVVALGDAPRGHRRIS